MRQRLGPSQTGHEVVSAVIQFESPVQVRERIGVPTQLHQRGAGANVGFGKDGAGFAVPGLLGQEWFQRGYGLREPIESNIGLAAQAHQVAKIVLSIA
jgi:hypothetical protein